MQRKRSHGSERQADDIVTQGPPENPTAAGKNSDDRAREPVPPSSGAPVQLPPDVSEAVRWRNPHGTDEESADYDRNA
jgi:hypothetical protein